MVTISIYPSEELKEWIENKSKEDNRSVNQEIIFLLTKIKEKENE